MKKKNLKYHIIRQTGTQIKQKWRNYFDTNSVSEIAL